MRVVHINAHDGTGGAARAMHRLHTGLQRAGVASSVFVREKVGNDPSVQEIHVRNSPLWRLRRRVRWERIRREYSPHLDVLRTASFHTERSVFGDELVLQLPPHDVVNLHWVAGFVDYGSFFEGLPRNTGVVWTLHDINPLTGGCHQARSCRRFEASCGCCPVLDSHRIDDLSRNVVERKRRIFARLPSHRLRVVSPSHWLAGEVKRSSLLSDFEITVIPNGVDVEVFRPGDKRDARASLGLPSDATIILFVSQSRDNPMKGFALLQSALACLRDRDQYLLVCIGHGTASLSTPVRSIDLGVMSNDDELARAYVASDVVVVPYLWDNLPNTVLEAMACGTPVVGHRSGGIPEMVRPRRSGVVVDCSDASALANAIEYLAAHPQDYAASCRELAVAEYSISTQAERYLRLYSAMIAGPAQA
jgi:glycosyltransferase involved in cell wall biosynthesis